MSIRNIYIIAETDTTRDVYGELILQGTKILQIETNRDVAREVAREINLTRGEKPRNGVSMPVRVFAFTAEGLLCDCDEVTVVR